MAYTSVKEDFREKKHLIDFSFSKKELSTEDLMFKVVKTRRFETPIITPHKMLVHTLLVLSAVTSLAQSELSFRPGAGRHIRVGHTQGPRGPRSVVTSIIMS